MNGRPPSRSIRVAMFAASAIATCVALLLPWALYRLGNQGEADELAATIEATGDADAAAGAPSDTTCRSRMS